MTQVKTVVQFAADGTITGQTEESSTGILAYGLRYVGGLVQQAGQETAVQRQLQTYNTPGTGHFELGHSAELHDPAVIKNDFKLNDRFKSPALGGTAAIPIGMPFSVRPGNFLFGARLSGRQYAFPCLAGSQNEDIDAIFDPALPMPIPPAGISIDNAFFTYRSTYRTDNRTLKIHREFVSLVSRQTCSPESEAQIAADLSKVRIDLYSGYRFSVPTPRPAAPPVAELTSQVTTDQSKQIAYIYDLKLDCSPVFATVSTIELPKHGKVSVDHGTGFSSFPQNNSHFDCNKSRTEGVTIAYQPDRGFNGDDTLTVDVLYADKSVARRHYAIKVAPGPEAIVSPPTTANQISANTKPPMQITELTRVAVQDQKLRITILFSLNPDCSVIGIPTARILETPKSGAVTVEKATGFPNFPIGNSYVKCNDKSTDGEAVFYMPNPGYVGPDSVTVEAIYPDGLANTRRYAIEVK
jgi:hypothetical protein